MDYLDEAVGDLYSDPDMLEMMEDLEDDRENEPQEYGTEEATLFDL